MYLMNFRTRNKYIIEFRLNYKITHSIEETLSSKFETKSPWWLKFKYNKRSLNPLQLKTTSLWLGNSYHRSNKNGVKNKL